MTVALDYDAIRADTVRHVAKLMAAAAITAPKSGGQLFLQGKHLFIERRRRTPRRWRPQPPTTPHRVRPNHLIVLILDACHPDLPDDTLPA